MPDQPTTLCAAELLAALLKKCTFNTNRLSPLNESGARTEFRRCGHLIGEYLDSTFGELGQGRHNIEFHTTKAWKLIVVIANRASYDILCSENARDAVDAPFEQRPDGSYSASLDYFEHIQPILARVIGYGGTWRCVEALVASVNAKMSEHVH